MSSVPDYITAQIVQKAREAQDGYFDTLSHGEQLAAALVLNRHDWLEVKRYTYTEAIERIGPEWASRLPAAAKLLGV